MRDQIFISYSHRDRAWLNRLRTMLKPLVRNNTITVWDDTCITPGSDWRTEIQRALVTARVAVLLVSPDFLASDFIAEEELPPLLAAAEQEGLKILWVAVRDSLYEKTAIGRYQAVNDPYKPLQSLRAADKETALKKICEAIEASVQPSLLPAGRCSADSPQPFLSQEAYPSAPSTLHQIDIPIEQASRQEQEKQARLHALVLDHSSFIQDRLASFVGRSVELAEIRQRITENVRAGGYVTITGQAGQGKSSVIAKLVQEAEPEQVAHHFIPFNPGPDHQVSLLRNLMARLILKYNLSDLYVASESRPALRDYFAKVLHEVAAKGGQEVIYIDGLDQIEEDLNGVRDLSFLPNDPPPGMVFVLGTRPPLGTSSLQSQPLATGRLLFGERARCLALLRSRMGAAFDTAIV